MGSTVFATPADNGIVPPITNMPKSHTATPLPTYRPDLAAIIINIGLVLALLVFRQDPYLAGVCAILLTLHTLHLVLTLHKLRSKYLRRLQSAQNHQQQKGDLLSSLLLSTLDPTSRE